MPISHASTKQSGGISVTKVTIVMCCIVMIIVGIFLYMPSQNLTPELINAEVESTESKTSYSGVPSRTKKIDSEEVGRNEKATPLGYCADKDIEVIGYEWNEALARAKTRSANKKRINSKSLRESPAYQKYVAANLKNQYSRLGAKLGSSAGLGELINHDMTLEIIGHSKNDSSIAQLIEKYAGNKEFLANILTIYNSKVSLEEYEEILSSHNDIDGDFIFRVLSSNPSIPINLIEATIAYSNLEEGLSKENASSGNKLLFLALAHGNFNYIPYILDLDLRITPSQDASLYFALASGMMRNLSEQEEIAQILEQLPSFVGPPTFNDVLAITEDAQEKTADYFTQYNINIEEHITYQANVNILDIPDEELENKLTTAQAQWPHYILRINPNSDCASETHFHWSDKTLNDWYDKRLVSDDDFAKLDEELMQTSRLYVERAHYFYYSGMLTLKPKEYRLQDDQEFLDKAFKAIFEAKQDQKLGDLFSEPISEQRQEVLRSLLVSLLYDMRTFDTSANFGFVYNEYDMLTAIKNENDVAIKWLLKNGIGINGTDQLNNGVLYWLMLTQNENYLQKIPKESIQNYYNSSGLNPHELHYIKCEEYGDVDAMFLQSEIGRDLKSQIKTEACEQVSGYRRALELSF